MFYTSRDGRFHLPVSFKRFLVTLHQIENLMQCEYQNIETTIRTCETVRCYMQEKNKFWANLPDVREAYTPHTFTKQVWKNALSVDAYIRPKNKKISAVVRCSIDRNDERHRVCAFVHATDAFEGAAHEVLTQPNWRYKIGDGLPLHTLLYRLMQDSFLRNYMGTAELRMLENTDR